MPSAGAVRAGEAYVKISTSNTALDKGLRSAMNRLKLFGSQVSAFGGKMMTMGAALAAPFALGAKAFANFEQQMANVSTMVDDPAKHMQRLNAGVRDMAKEFGESTEALAGGLYDILSASVPVEKSLDVLRVSVRAAKAGMTDTKTAADAITTVLNSYGLSADKAASVSDLLFAVVKRGKTTFAELAPAIGMVASTAAAAGVPLEEMGAMIATLTRNGVRTDNAVTALNATIATFLKPTAEASAYAETLGFNLSTATLQAEGLEGVFTRIASLPPDAVAKLFPSMRSLRGVIPALKHMKEFSADVATMADRAGTTETAYQKMADTIAFRFSQMKQELVGAFIDIGEAALPVFEDILKTISAAAKVVAQWVKDHEAIVRAVAKVAVNLVKWGATLWLIGKAIMFVASVWKLVTIAISAAAKAKALYVALSGPKGLAIVALATVAALGAAALLNNEYKKMKQNMADVADEAEALKRSAEAAGATSAIAAAQARGDKEITIGGTTYALATVEEEKRAKMSAEAWGQAAEAYGQAMADVDAQILEVSTRDARSLSQLREGLIDKETAHRLDAQKKVQAMAEKYLDTISRQLDAIASAARRDIGAVAGPRAIRESYYERLRGLRRNVDRIMEEPGAATTRGIFNPAAMLSLQTRPQDRKDAKRTAEATSMSSKELAKIRKKLDRMKPATFTF